MDGLDWLGVVAAFTLATGVSYALLNLPKKKKQQQQRSDDRPRAQASAPPPNGPMRPAPPASAPPPVAAQPAYAPAPAPSPVVPPVAAPAPASARDGMVRLEYEEDDEIDPTKVGGHAARVRGGRIQPPVQKIVYDDEAETEEPTRAESLFLVSATAQTDRGLKRKQNEDSLLVHEEDNLYVVADGMGGCAGGATASQLAVKTIYETFKHKAFEGSPHDNVPREATELARAIQMANDKILETAESNSELRGMGTTLCAARFSPNKNRIYLGHVGDSRCYRLRNGTLTQMTADHTMESLGMKGPLGAQLSRAVGIWPTVPIDIVMGVPNAGDIYLLCSDGLTKMLPDEVIGQVLRSETEAKAIANGLVNAANARGGKDNITVVIIHVLGPHELARQGGAVKKSAAASA
jgi:protein phosphatase